MTSMTALMVSQIVNLQTLEQEILHILATSSAPLSCAQIGEQVPSKPDRETLSHEIFGLAQEGKIYRAGEVPAPPGTPRKTVAVYSLPGSTDTNEQAPAQPQKVVKNATRKDVLEFLLGASAPIMTADLEKAIGATMGTTSTCLSQLKKAGKVDRVGKAGGWFISSSAAKKHPWRTLPTREVPIKEDVVSVQNIQISAPPHEAISQAPPDNSISFSVDNKGLLTIQQGEKLIRFDRDMTDRLSTFLVVIDDYCSEFSI
jgi:hypothetical protein